MRDLLLTQLKKILLSQSAHFQIKWEEKEVLQHILNLERLIQDEEKTFFLEKFDAILQEYSPLENPQPAPKEFQENLSIVDAIGQTKISKKEESEQQEESEREEAKREESREEDKRDEARREARREENRREENRREEKKREEINRMVD